MVKEAVPAQRGGVDAEPASRTDRAREHPLDRKIAGTPRQLAQRNRLAQLTAGPAQRTSNGLPPQLRAGVEALSGMDMSDVVVHSNSAKPAQLSALAYAQGNEIHLGPGQERHLPHEAWHVVQQRQGRVTATRQLAGVGLNDDPALERDADVMGSNALRAGQGAMKSSEAVQRLKAGSAVRRYVVQAGKDPVKDAENKAKFAKAMKELNEKIAAANQKIQDIHKIKAAFATDTSTTPMNPAVFVKDMATTETLSISKAEARLANFSALIKEFVNSQQKSNVTPEIQVALVRSAVDAAESIYISGNTQNSNNKIGAGDDELGAFYAAKIRSINISKRADGLRGVARKQITRQKGKSPTVKAAFRKKIAIDSKDGKDEVAAKVVRRLLTENKRSFPRRSATSSRKFVKKHSNKRVRVPDNSGNIHAESAILKSLRDTKQAIQEIGGTKVACLACQAYFTQLGQGGLLGNNTGYAWVSESSLAQLGFVIAQLEDTEKYLASLIVILQSRLASLKRYKGHAGDKKTKDMEVESDVDDTDSEDEESMALLIKDDVIQQIAGILLRATA
jgi:hypothetical protein